MVRKCRGTFPRRAFIHRLALHVKHLNSLRRLNHRIGITHSTRSSRDIQKCVLQLTPFSMTTRLYRRQQPGLTLWDLARPQRSQVVTAMRSACSSNWTTVHKSLTVPRVPIRRLLRRKPPKKTCSSLRDVVEELELLELLKLSGRALAARTCVLLASTARLPGPIVIVCLEDPSILASRLALSTLTGLKDPASLTCPSVPSDLATCGVSARLLLPSPSLLPRSRAIVSLTAVPNLRRRSGHGDGIGSLG